MDGYCIYKCISTMCLYWCSGGVCCCSVARCVLLDDSWAVARYSVRSTHLDERLAIIITVSSIHKSRSLRATVLNSHLIHTFFVSWNLCNREFYISRDDNIDDTSLGHIEFIALSSEHTRNLSVCKERGPIKLTVAACVLICTTATPLCCD